VDSGQFLDRYPEFETASATLLEKTLVETAARLDASVFGSRFDEAHGALTAHHLWSSAFGVSLRLDGDADASESKYLAHFRRIEKVVTVPETMFVI
jgi:hypothetical protein